MPTEKAMKVRMLKLYEILKQETDEDHPMGTTTIIAKLTAGGFPIDRRVLYRYIAELNKNGFEVLCIRAQSNMYFVANKDFDVPELRIMIDAIQAASFITETKSKALMDKLAALGGSYIGQILKKHTFFNTVKSKNENILYNVAALDEAIVTKRKVTFKYFDYNEHGKRQYRKDGERYEVNPLALVFSDDNYYLVCFSDKYLNLSNYRIDRMDSVQVTTERMTEAECAKTLNLNEYRRQNFSMYRGKKTKVELQFDKSLLDTIFDIFGPDTGLSICGDSYSVGVYVDVSPMFFGWCASFTDRLKITYPESVVDEYKEHMAKAMEQYK